MITNEKIKNLKPYAAIKDSYEIRLDANESFIPRPKEFLSEVIKDIEKVSLNRYPDSTADEVCRAFAQFYNVKTQNVVVGNGSDELINVICQIFACKDDCIAVTSPDFSMYGFYAKLMQAKVVSLDKKDNQVDVDGFIDFAKKNKAKILFFSNPCNPTGLIIERQNVIKILNNFDGLVVVDEAYMDFSDQSVMAEVDNFDNLIILKTLSKAFALASIRVGFAVGNASLISIIKAAKSPYNADTISQIFAKTALHQKTYAHKCIDKIVDETKWFFEQMLICRYVFGEKAIIYAPTANFIYISTPLNKSIDSCLKKNGICVRLFTNALRVTCGTREENLKVLSTLKEFGTNREV